MNRKPLGIRVSKKRRQCTDGNGRHPDNGCQQPTAHLHRQGRLTEDRKARDRMWRDQVRQGLIEGIPYLNTRIDLTLKLGTEDFEYERSDQDRDQDRTSLVSRLGIGNSSGHRYQEAFDPSNFSRRWYRFSESDFARDVGYWMHEVNRRVLRPRRSDRQPPRLNAFMVLEYSPGGRPHLHALVERPSFISLADFAAVIRRAWLGTEVGAANMLVDEVSDLSACVTYNTKARDAFDRFLYVHPEPDERAWWRHVTADDRVPYGCGPIYYRR